MKKKIENFTFWAVAFIFCIAIIAVYKTFDNFNSIIGFFGRVLSALSPFIIAFVIAYILNMPVKRINAFLSSRTKPKFLSKHSLGISIVLSYIMAVAVIALVVGAVVPALYKNLLDFYNNSETYINNLKSFIKNIDVLKKFNILQNIEQMDISGAMLSLLGRIDGQMFQKYAAGLFTATSGIINVLVALIASVYMIIEKDTIIRCLKRGIRVIVKKEWVDDVFDYCHRINDIFTGYICSRILVCLAMACMTGIVLSIMGIKYAFALGIFIGFCDIIPYFGSIFASVLAVVINLLSGGLWSSVWLSIALIILQQIDGNVIGPKIMGDRLKISPLLTVVSVVVCGKLFGFVGMVLSVPVAAIIKVICSDIMDVLEKKRINKID